MRDAYWALVTECLTRFHAVPEEEAARRVADLIRDMSEAPEDIDTDIVFNLEEFDLASDLAGSEMDSTPYWDEYLEMMDRHYAAVRLPHAAAALLDDLWLKDIVQPDATAPVALLKEQARRLGARAS